MKKIMITVLIMFLPFLFFAQMGVGGGIEYSLHLGTQIKADFPVSKVFSIDPYVTYVTYVDKVFDGISSQGHRIYHDKRYNSISIGAEGHYNFYVKDKIIIYPLVGINYHINFYYNKLKFTVGAGSSYSFTKKIKGYIETKYLHRNESIGLDLGILFILNKN